MIYDIILYVSDFVFVPMIQTKVWLSIIAITGILTLGVAAVPPMAIADDEGDSGIPQIEDASVKVKKNHLKVKIETEDKIPKDGSAGLFGYAVLTSGLNNVLAITTHLCASDSPVQNNAPNKVCPDAGAFGLLEALTGGDLLNKDYDGAKWHAHVLDLKPADGLDLDDNGVIEGEAEENAGCAGIDGAALEVDFASTLGTGNNVSPDYKLKVTKDTIKVKAPLGSNDVMPDGSGIGIVSFGIGATVNEVGTITDLCVLNPTPFVDDG